MRLSYTILLFALSFSFHTATASEGFGIFDGTIVPVHHFEIANHRYDSCRFAINECFIQAKFRRRSDNTLPASLWEIDVSRPGDFCYLPNAKVVLWRPDIDEADLLIQYQATNDEEAYSIPWEEGQDTMTWPFDTSPKAGTYLMGINFPSNQIVFHQIPSEYSSIREIKNWMGQAEQGCSDQVSMLNEKKYEEELSTLLKKPAQVVMNY